MPIEHINKTDTLNEGREKLNAAIDGANAADVTSKAADTKATQALANSESTQTQLDTIVIDGDSSVEAAQARVDEKGDPHPTLKARIDDGMNSVNQQLAETMNYLADFGVNVSAYGFVGDGTVEDAEVINQLILDVSNRGGGTVYIPSSETHYLIRVQEGIVMQSNVNLKMDINAVIKATPTGNSAYGIITCRNISNFSIEGGNIIGERYEHIGTTGQQGHGIRLNGATDFTIKNIKISECWGDGIYIGPSSELAYCENGLIEDIVADDNRRQGASITSAKNIKFIRPRLMNTHGHDPQAGMDIEANGVDDFMEDIYIERPYTENNSEYGIIVSLGKMADSGKKVSITIKDHKDVGSSIGFGFIKHTGVLDGFIRLDSPHYEFNKKQGIIINRHFAKAPLVEIIAPTIVDAFEEHTSPYESIRYGGIINISRDFDDGSDESIGNIKITEPVIRDSRKIAYSDIGIYDEMNKVENVSVIDPVFLEHKVIRSNSDYLVNVQDKNDLLVFHATPSTGTSYPIYDGIIYKTFDNEGAGGTRTFFLSSRAPIGSVITVKNTVDSRTVIISMSSETIILPYQESNENIRNTTRGTKITLRKISTDRWAVENVVGVWLGLND